MGRLAGFTYRQVTRNCGGWDSSLIGKHEEVTRSGGTLIRDIEPLFPIIQEIYQKELYPQF